ncbi:uncharacterized protein ACIQIH_010257 isoform 1-T1 [Cyanocitta cristata]
MDNLLAQLQPGGACMWLFQANVQKGKKRTTRLLVTSVMKMAGQLWICSKLQAVWQLQTLHRFQKTVLNVEKWNMAEAEIYAMAAFRRSMSFQQCPTQTQHKC